jgi:hypothetical protein
MFHLEIRFSCFYSEEGRNNEQQQLTRILLSKKLAMASARRNFRMYLCAPAL